MKEDLYLPVIEKKRIEELLAGISNHWELLKGKLVRDYEFKNFPTAINFVNKLAILAETEQHHPDIEINYNKVKLTLFTHSKKALTLKDFILAERISEID